MLPNTALTATVTELEQPNRFDWRCETQPDGWQAHVHNADSSKGDASADAVETVVAHMKRKGMPDEVARKAVTIIRLQKAPAVVKETVKVEPIIAPPANHVATPVKAPTSSGVVVKPTVPPVVTPPLTNPNPAQTTEAKPEAK